MDADRFLQCRNTIAKHLGLSRNAAAGLVRRMPEADCQAVIAAGRRLRGAGAVAIRHITAPYREPVPAYPGPGRRVRLRGVVGRPTLDGPSTGMFALQQALRAEIGRRRIDWLTISGEAHPDDLLWFWNWQDKEELLWWDGVGRPYVCGPNILFGVSWDARADEAERTACDSPHCRLIFTESAWYGRLIQRHRGPTSLCPLVLWPYPIDPAPGPPVVPPRYDLLVFVKSGPVELAEPLAGRYPRSIVLRYGHFHRPELFEAARQSRACVYLSEDDRGPLALAEILCGGCPAVGVERGAPWVNIGGTGICLKRFELPAITEAVEELLTWDRDQVHRVAREYFDPQRVAGIVLEALDRARHH